ncbi:hypothetical protein E2542_SST25809 [Spatholobus suberectus]|nr:hypothetical protein E2542_SST25809 [Spatholobus suberectus]
MPMPERTYRHIDTSRSPTIASVEQFLRGTGGDSARMSPTYSSTSSNSPSSPYFERLKHHDPEEDHGLYQKKSVLTKVKEKARKFRNSLSKRRQEDENVTPSWGVSLEDEEEEEDAEYLGAPMYESELAPEGYKENARQHPRANPVISEKHVLKNTVKLGVRQDQEKPRGPVNVKSTTTTTQPATITPTPPNMTSETIAQKLTPAYTRGSNAAHSISSKIQAAVSTAPPAANNMSSQTSSTAPLTSSVPSPKQNSPSSSAPLNKNTSQKGASVKDYLMNKSEPRDDAKTVSQPQVTSEATSPMRTSSNAGVMDKVIGAVNSLLSNEEPSQQYGVKTPTTRTSSQTQQEAKQQRTCYYLLMEDKANLIKRRGGCPTPTRLQKHAPASLDIDKVLSDRPSNPFSDASRAIPLLSPLILSPQPMYADITIQVRTSENENNGSGSASRASSTGWQHPAMASFPEPSSLCSFFQKQCVFLNHAQ